MTKRSQSRNDAQYPLRISVGRLRGSHGSTLLGGILRKIERADVLFFDISGSNPNVLFELGYALAIKGADSGRIYVFNKTGKAPCSDFSGYMLTYYSDKTSDKIPLNLKLEDAKGFLAALRSTLIEIAEERGMLGLSKKIIEFDAASGCV